MRDVVMPLLTEAHDRLAAQRARNRPARQEPKLEEMSG